MHVCAIYTLSQAPLSIFTCAARWGVDLTLAFAIILAVAGLRLYYNSLLVMFMFLMHPSVEHSVKAMGQGLRRAVPAAWRNFIFGPEKGYP